MDDTLMARLAELAETILELEGFMSDPEVISDQVRFTELTRRHAELRPIVADYHELVAALADVEEAKELAQLEIDPDMAGEFKQMAADRARDCEGLEERLRLALVPKDPNDGKDVIIEIRAGTGGDEAALWAGDLLRMYEKYSEKTGFKTEVISTSHSESGGYKEVSLSVRGAGAYGVLKYEGGVHRVQRVPKTESQGRVHTSTATVAAMPEVEEAEFDLNVNDVRVDVYRSSGPGGQSVNTTDSAVRLTHEPTGVVVTSQDQKSQLQNKEKAFRVLRARLYQVHLEEQQSELAATRRDQVGTGGRSEKIRTYNYKDSRVTDHRIGLTIKQLQSTLEGDLDPFISQLQAEEQAARLAEGE